MTQPCWPPGASHPSDEGGVSVLGYHDGDEDEPHSRSQVELPMLHFLNGLRFEKQEAGTEAISSRLKSADGRLSQCPKSSEAHPPWAHERGHSNLVGLWSGWPYVDSGHCHSQEMARW